MRPRAAAAIVLLLLTLPFGGGLGPRPAGAQSAAADRLPANRVTLVGLESGQLSEADLEHGVTILVVWASWSPRCRDIVARINALAASWSSRARVASVVFQEDPATVRHFLDDQSLDGKDLGSLVFIDTSGAFSKKHAVTTLPSLLVFDSGKTAFRGKLPAAPDPIIERALASDAG
ncbi:MAG: TlpA disulfide reductase family protein [Thermoanaerobaculia bacterium]